MGSDAQRLLEVVEYQQPRIVAELCDDGVQRRSPSQVGAHLSADRGEDHLRLCDRLQRDEHGAGTEAIAEALANGHREPGLADSAWPRQCHQPDVGAQEDADHLFDVPLAADERCRPCGHRARALARRPRTSCPGTVNGKPLTQHSREVVAQQLLQLIGGPEVAVGGLLSDPEHELFEAGLAIGRRHLGIQQARQIVRQLELLFQPRNLHARLDTPIALPVEAHEDVALRQVRPIEVARRVRSRALLEHHGVSPSAEMAAAAACRSSESSTSVELTNTRRRWSGVLMTGVSGHAGFTDCSGARGWRHAGSPRQFGAGPLKPLFGAWEA